MTLSTGRHKFQKNATAGTMNVTDFSRLMVFRKKYLGTFFHYFYIFFFKLF